MRNIDGTDNQKEIIQNYGRIWNRNKLTFPRRPSWGVGRSFHLTTSKRRGRSKSARIFAGMSGSDRSSRRRTSPDATEYRPPPRSATYGGDLGLGEGAWKNGADRNLARSRGVRKQEEQVVLGRMQLMNKAVITRSTGVNLGTVAQV